MPSVFKEGKIDFDALKAVLGDVVEPSREFYNFIWAGKSEAFRTLQRPSTATLKPCEEESKEWDTTENLFIEGDNLEVLKLLQKTYHNSIKMIYIDPPYNKDKDFVYPDRWSEGIKSYKEFCGFVDSEGNITTSEDEAKNATGRKHSRWLTMMYPRLFLARNLLKDDGVIFVSIDDDEAANLKKIMDEIFGEENFVGQFIWKSKLGKVGTTSTISTIHEYILCFSKNVQNISFRMIEKHNDGRKENLRQWGQADRREDRPSMFYPLEINGTVVYPIKEDGSEGRWRVGKELAADLIAKNMLQIENKNGKNEVYRLFEAGISEIPYDTLLLDEIGTTAKGSIMLKELDMPNSFDYSKPIELIKFFTSLCSSNNDIILDFFAGSSTTAHAVMALNAEDGGNRKYICVQIPEPTPENSEAKKAGYKTIAEISKERIRRAGEKVKADNPLFAGDIGFKVFKLDESNFKQWDKEVTDAETLKQQIIEFADNVSPEASKANMLYELLLKKGYSLNAKVEKKQIADNEIFVVDDSMLVCLDDKISTTTIDEVIKLRPAHFIVLDRAFEGNDKLKTNTWQTFKTLFPNDENPFETV